ncbi:MAG: DoxX family protein [Ilumatobacteraceae bacterium]
MDVLSTTFAVVTALVCLVTAAADFKVLPQTLETMERLRMPIRIIPALGAMKVAGALGLLIGIWIDALGSCAAFCLSLYFLIATGLHLRARDTAARTAPAVVLFVLSVVTFITSF